MSQDALEVMGVSHRVSESELADLTDVTLVSDDTYRRLDLCDSGKWGSLLETWLMLLWGLRIPKEDLTDATVVSEDAL